MDNVALDDEVDDGDDIASSDEVVWYCQYFPIKGAAWDERYQKALQICSRKLLLEEEVQVRVTPEPENISNKNALRVLWPSQNPKAIEGNKPKTNSKCFDHKLEKILGTRH